MHVEMKDRGSFSQRGKHRLFRLAAESVKDFFKAYEPPLESVSITAFRAERNGNPQVPVRVLSVSPDHSPNPCGVPVIVHTEGTQGLACMMTVQGWDDEQLKTVIVNGPYLRKSKVEALDPTTYFTAEVPEEPQPAAPAEEQPAPAPVAAQQEAVRRTPLERLRANNVPDDDIERLRATLASIVYRKVGDKEVPNTLLVPVNEITDAILEHMGLSRNAAGTYQGIIGSFFSSRISIFALKWHTYSDESKYADWLFDCLLVLDFVGGQNQLASLTRVRDEEVREMRKREADVEANPPPRAEEVEQAVSFTDDAALLDLAAKTLDGRRMAEQEALLAETNAAKALEQMQAVEFTLAKAKAEHDQALSLVTAARSKISEYVLSDDLLAKVRAAKARIDDLMKKLGI